MKDLIKSVIESHRGYQNPVSVDALNIFRLTLTINRSET